MRIIGQLVCGPGEADRYLQQTLEEFKRLCDDVIVCLCNAGKKEKALVDKYDFRSYEDNREWGIYQPSIKTDLLRRIQMLDPSYILVLDADETVPTLTRYTLEQLAQERRALQLFVVNLWNDEQHYSPELCFWNVRGYNPNAYTSPQFMRKAVHCGNAPPSFYALPAKETYVPHILLHRGLMLPGDRIKKSTRYQQYDPHAIHKGRDYYDSLQAERDGTVYSQAKVLEEITNYYSKL
jgi:hypothetical protein